MRPAAAGRACAGLVLFALALPAAALPAAGLPARAEGIRPAPTGFSAGPLGGIVVDPAPYGIEQAHGAAGLVLQYGGRCALSFRPTVLFNASELLLRLPLQLRLPLGSGAERACSFGLIGSAGACTWTGEPAHLQPLLSAGLEVDVGALGLTAAASAVIAETGVDFLGDLLLAYLWGLAPEGQGR